MVLSSSTVPFHLAMKFCGEKLYGQLQVGCGAFEERTCQGIRSMCAIDGERKAFDSRKEARKQIKDKYGVEAIVTEGDTVVFTLQKNTSIP